jgi:hypothetical protein
MNESTNVNTVNGPRAVAVCTPAPGEARLILNAREPMDYNANREEDARTALTRGLAEYCAQLSIAWSAGRKLKFNRTFAQWAEVEDQSTYPTAIAMSDDVATYDAHGFKPTLIVKDEVPLPVGQDLFLAKTSELVIPVTLHVWATDVLERKGLCAMLEDAFSPVEWMFGFRLDLPYYFGQRAEYELQSSSYLDSEEDATRGYRRAQFVLRARVPVTKLVSLPAGRPRIKFEVKEPS